MKGLSPAQRGVLQSIGIGDAPQGQNLDTLLPAFDQTRLPLLNDLRARLTELQKNAPPAPEFAMALQDRGDAHDGVVFRRGNPETPGGPAPRRFLLALSKAGEERAHWTDGSGRLDLARAIASPTNPLTARVIVNRLWGWHFGAGIVRTASDFGHQGDPPTDPKLLDYLAVKFIKGGWSIKKLQKLIVTSGTYRQSSEAPAATLAADPDNRLWGRMNRERLDLEEMHDTVLDDSGQLDLSQVGGRSVELWTEPYSHRRAVYGFIERQNLPGTFRTFDLASPDTTSGRRFVTTVPQQALFFMNSPFVVEAAEALAKRPSIAAAKGEEVVKRLYRLLFLRSPTSAELALGDRYLGKNPLAPLPGAPDIHASRLSLYAQALLMTNELMFLD